MNSSQKQTILNAIESFEKTDFETAFGKKYKDTATIDSIFDFPSFFWNLGLVNLHLS
ncbi:MAG: hypothetical protein IJM43_08685 [Bacteroidaceae bacterium]|nr:hypothetical protein [Bacteroidaceae bacterium]